ncbi:probable tRNA (guanine(26)-N(2))-dimethyltransferase 2 isoform X2 [Arachis ipaensis]|uniref:probable tRNA (guanine(26)-N(2))-dimethyltransferase 2 isoform X2 n=1 Tax=Arachis ipaensis TaxID=130454 RepID=UPI0007AFD7BA|nr:probable tRNA (guanine(26)-N(2))-dimethyltransferase 2 isoform X2 [Arachis ipaensis]XP_025682899.1 probable tRNA (guanine(26)-N(2))-dimethyltransferase 2 isoform X2 [Arachis hypogaea]QHN83762.1 putative tRNA (guanine(26)-N(2))-dimethyltransferase [Arachis hypogaea]
MLFAEGRFLKLQLKLYTSTITAINHFSLLKYCSSFSAITTEQVNCQEQQKEHTLNSILHYISSTMSTDLNDYKIIKEGEAEILMHAKNEVFYNKTQVNNRDISITVLREFISRREQEHEATLSKRKKGTQKATENESVKEEAEDVPRETPSENHESNGKCEGEENTSPEELEACSSVKGSAKIAEDCSSAGEQTDLTEGKGHVELKPPRVLEALSASGLRSLRYAREVEGIGQVVALDNDIVSVEACRRNIKFNGSVAISKVESHHVDARVYMLTHPKEFDVVDLDPYGSPSVFLDSAVQSVADGGILMCTATDMAVLCGANGEVCYSKYGSYPLRGKYCHEMALRILLASIESHANRYKRYIVPVLSVQMDFYVRVFVRIYTSASAMKNTPLKLSYVYQCTGCDSFHLQPIGRTISKNTSVRYLPGFGPVVPQECSDCGKKFTMGGPIWSAPIHDQDWVGSILADVKSMKNRYPAYDRISAVLTTISEELTDVPLFLSLHNLCATLKCTSPSAVMFRSAVINAGYRISGTHVNPLGLKSDAPMDVIWDIMRCWVKNHPVKAQPADQPGSVILAKEPVLQASFARAISSLSKAQAKKVVRFLPNPERHWGPKLRAGRQITSKHVSLLGPAAVNGALNHEDDEEPKKSEVK